MKLLPTATAPPPAAPFLVFATALLLLLSSCPAQAVNLYNIVVYSKNAPQSALDKIMADQEDIWWEFFEFEPDYEFVPVGTYFGRRRDRRQQRERGLVGVSASSSSLQEEQQPIDAQLSSSSSSSSSNSNQRSLQGIKYCPKSCKKASSQKCKSLGCAGGGGRRLLRRRDLHYSSTTIAGQQDQAQEEQDQVPEPQHRQLQASQILTAKEIYDFEDKFNDKLEDYCNSASGCDIWCKITLIV